MNIPLVAGADLSKYQSKAVSPKEMFQYAGLHWTLTLHFLPQLHLKVMHLERLHLRCRKVATRLRC